MAQHHEIQFEKELCEHLEAHGWLYSPTDAGYDRNLALFPEDVFAWLEATQPDELAKQVKDSMSEQGQAKAKDGLLTRLVKVLDTDQTAGGGSLNVLRRGFKHLTASFTMMQRRPEQSINPTVNARYEANRLRVMRQVHYSTAHNNSIDLVFFVNGIPMATAELKTDFTQTISHAKNQYRKDRLPAGEPLLGFGTRALVHFAVSNDEVWMTTRLAGDKTFFLPFNRGHNGKAGNGPDEDGGSPTTYLWRDVLQRDQWLDILAKFIHYETDTKADPKTGKLSKSTKLIFPRFHQLDAVTKLVDDVKTSGPGSKYLIQHSAGSGKTRSIAWSAHRLATLHDDHNKKVFDTVIVVTDRNVLDAQLQEAIKQIETTAGVVATISQKEASSKSFGSKSSYLASALTSGKLIVVVTLQTFPFVLDAIDNDQALKGRSFAVIADEAHSSQTGTAASKLKEVLSDQELADLSDGGEIDVEAVLALRAAQKADSTNISFIAFTATPKAKTLELFGTRDTPDAIPRPFHTYTMAQAIEERFILDVLTNYTTYDTAWQLALNSKKHHTTVTRIADDGTLVEESAAIKGLMKWVKLHPTNIAQKVAIIVEFFEENVKHLLDGHAKAMVVTQNRKAAVRYKKAIDAYIKKRGYSDITALVAFSGEVVFDPTDLIKVDEETVIAGESYTESSMNPGVKDLRSAFDTDEYQVMIVANKFQTGFDQPKLCFMAVDKKLGGVATVQTLSRLNRYLPNKQTMILDFVNKPEDVLKDFQQFYAEASLTGTTDPNLIHDLGAKLDTAGIYTQDELEAVVTAFVLQKGNNALTGGLQPIKYRFKTAWDAAVAGNDKPRMDELTIFRKDVGSYIRLYDFVSQIFNFEDTDVEKRATFLRLLQPHLNTGGGPTTIDLTDVVLPKLMQKQKTSQDNLGLHTTNIDDIPGMDPTTSVGSGGVHDPNQVLLDELIKELNKKFADENFEEHQLKMWVESIAEMLRHDDNLRAQAQVNSLDQFLASPTLKDAVMLAVASTADAQNRLSILFATKASVEDVVMEALGKAFYRREHDTTE